MPNEIKRLGWYETKSGKEIVVNYESANGKIGYRYKGSKRVWQTSGESFRRRFKNYHE